MTRAGYLLRSLGVSRASVVSKFMPVSLGILHQILIVRGTHLHFLCVRQVTIKIHKRDERGNLVTKDSVTLL